MGICSKHPKKRDFAQRCQDDQDHEGGFLKIAVAKQRMGA